jgi:hypothetical protein
MTGGVRSADIARTMPQKWSERRKWRSTRIVLTPRAIGGTVHLA